MEEEEEGEEEERTFGLNNSRVEHRSRDQSGGLDEDAEAGVGEPLPFNGSRCHLATAQGERGKGAGCRGLMGNCTSLYL